LNLARAGGEDISETGKVSDNVNVTKLSELRNQKEARTIDDRWLTPIWMLPSWVVNARESRSPPEVLSGPRYSVSNLDIPLARRLLSMLGKNVLNKDKLRFSLQYRTKDGRKQARQMGLVPLTLDDLLDVSNSTLLELVNTPEAMLSLNLKADSGLVMLDLDPQANKPDCINPLEKGLLRGLYALCQMTANPVSTDLPLVFQSPRGLHVLFKVDPSARPKISSGTRDYVTRLGLKCELITNGNCALIGHNYRLITPLTGDMVFPYLPMPLWPVGTNLKDPIVFEEPIPHLSRYKTLLGGARSGQFVTPGGVSLLEWINSVWCVPDAFGNLLRQEEVWELDKIAAGVQSKYKGALARKSNRTPQSINEQFDEGELEALSRPISEVSNDLTYGQQFQRIMYRLTTELSSKSVSFLDAESTQEVRNFLQDPNFKRVAQSLQARVLFSMYTITFGDAAGAAFATSTMIHGKFKFLVFVAETEELLFYRRNTGVWVSLPESILTDMVRNLLDQMGSGRIVGLSAREAITRDVKERITVENFGGKFPGFAFQNGVRLFGHREVLEPRPDYHLRTFVDAENKKEPVFQQGSVGYFKNLTSKNPSSIHLLRDFLFNSLYNVRPSGHFLVIQGPPSTGKSLLFKFLDYLFGMGSVYNMSDKNFEGTFAFAGVESNLRFVVFADADKTSNYKRILSLLKEHSTADYLRIKKKNKNKELTIKGVRFALVVNEFLEFPAIAEALERRQIILMTQAISNPGEIRDDLFEELIRDIPAVMSWIEGMPFILGNLVQYSATLNYLSSAESFKFNPVADFLIENAERLYITPGDHTPLVSIPAAMTTNNSSIPGLYDDYVAFCTANSIESLASTSDFARVVGELFRTVFFLSSGSSGVSRVYVPGTKTGVRAVLVGITYDRDQTGKWGAFEQVCVKIPLKGAVLALLHPTCSTPSDQPDTLPIHYKYPHFMLEAFFEVVQKGPSPVLSNAMSNYQLTVLEQIAYCEMDDQVQAVVDDQFLEMKVGQKAEELIDSKPYIDVAFETPSVPLPESETLVSLIPEGEGLQDVTRTTRSLLPEFTPMSLKPVRTPKKETVSSVFPKNPTVAALYGYVENLDALRNTKQPITEAETTISGGQRELYIARDVFIKLSKWFVGDADWNQKAAYYITRDCTLKTILSKDGDLDFDPIKAAIGPYEFHWNKEGNTLVDCVALESMTSSKTLNRLKPVKQDQVEVVPPLAKSQVEVEPPLAKSQVEVEPPLAKSQDLGEVGTPLDQDLEEVATPLAQDLGEVATPLAQDLGEVEPPLAKSQDLGEVATPQAQDQVEVATPLDKDLEEVATPLAQDLGEVATPQDPDLGEVVRETMRPYGRQGSNSSVDVPETNKQPAVRQAQKTLEEKANEKVQKKAQKKAKRSIEAQLKKENKITKCKNIGIIMTTASQGMKDSIAGLKYDAFSKCLSQSCTALQSLEHDMPALPEGKISLYLGPLVDSYSESQKEHLLLRFWENYVLKKQTADEVVATLLEDEVFSQNTQPIDKVNISSYFIKPENYPYFQQLADFDWGIQGSDQYSLFTPNKQGKANEGQRALFAEWTNYCEAPPLLNRALEALFFEALKVTAFVNTVMSLIEDQIQFSEKTGAQKRTTLWKSMTESTIFAPSYSGGPETRDPGRLAIKGTNYTTFSRELRATVVDPLLKSFNRNGMFELGIWDLSGAHSVFQAALLKEKIPTLWELYQDPDINVWQKWVELSCGRISIKQKNALKTVYYAALNGGSIKNEYAILNHLRSNLGMSESEKSTFARSFLIHPITQELAIVGELWASCNGVLYVPTRADPIFRQITAEEASIKNAKTISWAEESQRPVDPQRLIKEGDGKPHRLPTLYFTSLEVIFMSKLVGYVVEIAKELGYPIGVLQGIHDGHMFIYPAGFPTTEVTKRLNEKLTVFSMEAIGVGIRASFSSIAEVRHFEDDLE